MKLFKILDETLPTFFFVGMGVLVISTCINPSKTKEIPHENIPVDTTSSSSMDICPKNLGTVTLEDLDIQPNLIYEAEDEYWEIEQIGDKYYRVRREDHEQGYQGKYEYNEEDLIGDIDDLYRYSKHHEITP